VGSFGSVILSKSISSSGSGTGVGLYYGFEKV
jgi:hypothetical protein